MGVGVRSGTRGDVGCPRSGRSDGAEARQVNGPPEMVMASRRSGKTRSSSACRSMMLTGLLTDGEADKEKPVHSPLAPKYLFLFN
jgi:hypothetical protein